MTEKVKDTEVFPAVYRIIVFLLINNSAGTFFNLKLTAAAAKSRESCPTLCDPIDGSPPGKNTGVGCHFLPQWVKVKSEMKSLSRVWLLAIPWTVAHQAPPSMGFSRQEYWSGVPLPSDVKILWQGRRKYKISESHSFMSFGTTHRKLNPFQIYF